MKMDIHYGKGLVSLQVPEASVEEIIRPWQDEAKADNATVVRQAMASREADSFQDEVIGKRVCVLIDDGTRDEPFGDMFGQVFGVLQKSSLVRFLICTGTHDAETADNNRIARQIEEAARKTGIKDFEFHTHDCEQDTFIKAGQTSQGTEVIFNDKADDADVFLVLSDVKVHYFAGYSNPIKNFVPGICAFETAEQNHSLALDKKSTFGVHPWHKDESRRSNPVAEDELEGMRLIVKDRPVYAFVTISTSSEITWARCGPSDRVCSEAFA